MSKEYKPPYGPEAVKGVDDLYRAAEARSERYKKKVQERIRENKENPKGLLKRKG